MNDMPQKDLFPHVGQSFIVNYGEGMVFRNTYEADGKTVIVEHLEGTFKGQLSTSNFNWLALADGSFLLSWQEQDKSTVVHCDNFERGVTHSFYTMMNGSFFELTGRISK